MKDAICVAPMATRLTPHILSLIDWSSPLSDPLRRQFIPTKSSLLDDHPKVSLDSLNELGDSPVPGLVHRYPDKALFLGKTRAPRVTQICLTKNEQHHQSAQYIVASALDRIRSGLRPNLSPSCASCPFGSGGKKSFRTLAIQILSKTLLSPEETHSTSNQNRLSQLASASFPSLISKGYDLLPKAWLCVQVEY